MMTIPEQGTMKLTHYGRKSGNSFHTTIWFVENAGELWIGSLDENRSWVKNLRATGKAKIDFGKGAEAVSVEFLDEDSARERHAAAIAAKYPVLSRVIGLFGRG